jgi:hypothetical protein
MIYMFNLDDYETVEERLIKYWKDHPDGQIHTEILESTASRFIVKASIFRTEADPRPWTTGLAEETVQGRGVNATSALENCETSAIGRALANAGYATKGKRASREEMGKVAAKQAVVEQIATVKKQMSETSQQYIPIAKADDPWTTWEAPQAATMEQAVETVKAVLGGTMPDESCIHGARIWKHGVSKAGNKPWGHWRCPNQATSGSAAGADDKCEPIWYEVKPDGTWGKRADRG